MRRVLLFVGLFCGLASAHALTFQFVSKSSRKIVVPTSFEAVTGTTIQQFFVVGKAGDDMVLQRIDRFANQFAQGFYDCPATGNEEILDVALSNANQPMVLYRDRLGAHRLVKFEATLGAILDVPVGSNDRIFKLEQGLAGTIIGAGSDSNGDIVVKKFSTNGSVVWRTVVLEGGPTAFKDLAVASNEEVAVVGSNTTQAIIARLRGSDGVRLATFVSSATANPQNRVESIAYAASANFIYGAGFLDNGSVNPFAFRIDRSNNANLAVAIPSFGVSSVDIAVSQAVTPKVVVVGDTGAGMRIALLNPETLSATVGVESHPISPKVIIPPSGGIFAFGKAGQDLIIPNIVARFDSAGLRTYSIASNTSADELIDAAPFISQGIIAVGSSRDANNQKVGQIVSGSELSQNFRVLEQRVHHPRRSLVDSAVDSTGAHFQLTDLDGAIEAPFVVKHSATGQQIWSAQLSFPGLPFIRPIAMGVGPNGHPVVVCTGKATADPDTGNWLIFQLNGPNGSVRWSKILAIGNTASGRPHDVDVHSDNSIGLVGRVNFFGIDTNMAAARLTTAGVVQWTRIFLTSGPDRLDLCRFRPTGELVGIGLVGGSFPGRLQLVTFAVDGLFQHQSVIEELNGTTSNMRLDMEPSGNIVVAYKEDVIPSGNPDPTVVRRINPLNGAPLMTFKVDAGPQSNILAKASPDGNVWVVHTTVAGLHQSFRLNGSTGAASQTLTLQAGVSAFTDLVVRSDNTAVISGIDTTGSSPVTVLMRRLPTGGQAAQRRLAGNGKFLRNGPGGVVWAAGDVAAQNRGTEQFAAKYTVP